MTRLLVAGWCYGAAVCVVFWGWVLGALGRLVWIVCCRFVGNLVIWVVTVVVASCAWCFLVLTGWGVVLGGLWVSWDFQFCGGLV